MGIIPERRSRLWGPCGRMQRAYLTCRATSGNGWKTFIIETTMPTLPMTEQRGLRVGNNSSECCAVGQLKNLLSPVASQHAGENHRCLPEYTGLSAFV